MKKSITYLAVLAILMAFSCKSKTTTQISFGSITERDKFGAVIGKPDTTDWRTDDVWSQQEKDLFTAKFAENAPRTDTMQIMFYTNPCHGKSVIYLQKKPDTKLSLRIVDRDYNVLMSMDDLKDMSSQINLSAIGVNDTVRMYYKFIDSKNNEFKGHGDIVLRLK
jgi:hypothetical protein